jgi:hypothetical protein
LFGLTTANKLSGAIVGDNCTRLVSFILKIKIKIHSSKVGMVCSPIYYFSAPKGKYLDPATSSHPIKAEGYEVRLDFISMVRELNFTGGFDENPYKHL